MTSRTSLALALALAFAAVGCGAPMQSEAVPAAPAAPAAAGGATAAPMAVAPPPAGAPQAEGRKPSSAEPAAPGRASTTKDTALLTGLSQDEIFTAVQQHTAVFDKCYGLAGKGKDLTGTVKLKATIGPAGTVNQAEVLTSGVKNPKVDACVVEGFKKVKFPPPHGGGTAVITFPMTFTGMEQVK